MFKFNKKAFVIIPFVITFLMPGLTLAKSREELVAENERLTKEYISSMKTALSDLLKSANDFSVPSEEKLKEYKDTAIRGRKYLRYLSREEQAEVTLAESWINFFYKDMQRALSLAGKAYITDPENGDAYATQAIFSILDGKSPKPRIKPKGLKSVNDDLKYTLDFVMPERVGKIVGKRYDQLSDIYKSLEFEGDYVAVMFWKIPEFNLHTIAKELKDINIEDAADIEKRKKEYIAEKMKGVEAEISAYKALSDRNTKPEEIKYIALNINTDSDVFEKAIEFAKSNGYAYMNLNEDSLEKYAKEFDNAMKNSDFRTLYESDTPVMVIINRSNVVEYAGSAQGILPVMVLGKILPGSLGENQSQKPAPKKDYNIFESPSKEKEPAKTKEPADSNSIQDIQIIEKKEKKPAESSEKSEKQYRQLSTEDEIQAQKLIDTAQMYRKSHTKLGSSKRVLEACREVIKRYPGTIYEEQAKEILRSIPEHQRKKLDISEDELK